MSLLSPRHGNDNNVWFSELHSWSSYAEGFNLPRDHFSIWCEVGVPLHSLARGYLVFPATFVERAVFSPWSGLGARLKNRLTVNKGCISGRSVLVWGSVCLSAC